MFDILSHKGNENKNNTEIPFPSSQQAIKHIIAWLQNKQHHMLGRIQEKETLYNVYRNVN
jgi:hypothetical protein